MKRIAEQGAFGYWRDPVCLLACAGYGLNRWILAPLTMRGSFWRGHFNDLLLIPAALPLVLWLQRRVGLRTNDAWPEAGEVALHLVVWALIAEVLGPRWFHHGTADWRDVVAYAAGALVCVILWRGKKPLARKPLER